MRRYPAKCLVTKLVYTKRNKPNRGRIRELDALRGFAVGAVLLFHYTIILPRYYPGSAPAPFLFPYGYYGVSLFFMISGYVILMTLERCHRGADFVVSRFSRLFPVFWASVLVTYSVGSMAPLHGQEYSLPQLLVNLTMLQSYLKVNSIDGVYWSLAYELGFYFAMYCLYKLRQLENIEQICIIWLVGALLFNFFPEYLPHPLHYLLVINDYGHLFAAGIVFYRVSQTGYIGLRVPILLSAVFVQYLQEGILGGVVIASFITIFALIVAGRLSILDNKFLVYLGTISYSLYLVHQLVGFRIIRFLQESGTPGPASLLVAALMTIALASLLTFGIERPAMALLRHKYKVFVLARQ